jgi:hypothetical protein
MTRDTVAGETPACCATSAIVVALVRLTTRAPFPLRTIPLAASAPPSYGCETAFSRNHDDVDVRIAADLSLSEKAISCIVSP